MPLGGLTDWDVSDELKTWYGCTARAYPKLEYPFSYRVVIQLVCQLARSVIYGEPP
jgi:hypothetical protein